MIHISRCISNVINGFVVGVMVMTVTLSLTLNHIPYQKPLFKLHTSDNLQFKNKYLPRLAVDVPQVVDVSQVIDVLPKPKTTANASVSRGLQGQSRIITVQATAYTATGYQTSSGTWPKAGRTIAVDPRLIKPGTKVHINRQALGVGGRDYVAEDSGGDIIGARIDLFMDSEYECEAWGRRTIQIELIN